MNNRTVRIEPINTEVNVDLYEEDGIIRYKVLQYDKDIDKLPHYHTIADNLREALEVSEEWLSDNEGAEIWNQIHKEQK